MLRKFLRAGGIALAVVALALVAAVLYAGYQLRASLPAIDGTACRAGAWRAGDGDARRAWRAHHHRSFA